jgi:hypothetical protein
MRRFAVLAGFGALLLLPALTPAQDRWHRDNDRWRHDEAHRLAYPDRAEDLVRSWYRKFLNREPDPLWSVWVGQVRGGQDPHSVLATILSSEEYYSKGGATPEGFVRSLFQDLTGRPPSPREMDPWVHRAYERDRTDVAYALLTRYPQTWTEGPYHPEEHRYDYRRPELPYRR